MRRLLHAVGQLALWQQMVVGAMLVLIFLTWLAVCLLLTGYLAP